MKITSEYTEIKPGTAELVRIREEDPNPGRFSTVMQLAGVTLEISARHPHHTVLADQPNFQARMISPDHAEPSRRPGLLVAGWDDQLELVHIGRNELLRALDKPAEELRDLGQRPVAARSALLEDIQYVSERHAQLEMFMPPHIASEYAYLSVTDLGSTNGTWIDSNDISSK